MRGSKISNGLTPAKMKIDIKKLATFSPLPALNADNLREIVAKSKVIELDAGNFLFKQDAKDKNNYYLVSGTKVFHWGFYE
jgi:hypothetical protein